MKTLGRIAYDRWRQLTGHPIVTWEQLPDSSRATWEAIAEAVIVGLEERKRGAAK